MRWDFFCSILSTKKASILEAFFVGRAGFEPISKSPHYTAFSIIYKVLCHDFAIKINIAILSFSNLLTLQ